MDGQWVVFYCVSRKTVAHVCSNRESWKEAVCGRGKRWHTFNTLWQPAVIWSSTIHIPGTVLGEGESQARDLISSVNTLPTSVYLSLFPSFLSLLLCPSFLPPPPVGTCCLVCCNLKRVSLHAVQHCPRDNIVCVCVSHVGSTAAYFLHCNSQRKIIWLFLSNFSLSLFLYSPPCLVTPFFLFIYSLLPTSYLTIYHIFSPPLHSQASAVW